MGYFSRSVILLLLPAVLSGCLNIGGDSKPVTLFRLNPVVEKAEGGEAAIPFKLSISSGSLLNSQRLWVYQGDTQVAGYAEARWAMPLPEMFRQTLISSLEQSGTGIVLEAPARAPTLRVAIRDFQIEANDLNATAIVAIKASWIDLEGNISHQLIRATESTMLDSASNVAVAMNKANQQVLRELQEWLQASTSAEQ